MKKPFSWKERIKRAIAVGHFTKLDKAKSRVWPTCAVGEHVPVLKTIHEQGGSIYLQFERMGHEGSTLEKLGMEFMDAIHKNKPYKARRLRCAIARVPV